ncbi:MAG TPA: PepSY-associated TM helix domain-containing protein [Terrimicrobiaceae bacterium]
MRRFLFLLHSWMGLIAGLGLIVIGLTGSILVFRQEIDNLVTPERTLAANLSEARLGLDALVARMREQLAGCEPVGWLRSRSAGQNDQVSIATNGGDQPKSIWIDPCNGTVHGAPASSTFTGWLLALHYSLLSDHAGTFVAGVFAALLFLLGITGIWIYRGFWKSLLQLRWNLSARIFFSDLHKMVGISSVGFNLILGFTGAYWNLTHVVGHMLDGPEPEPPKIVERQIGETLSLDALLEQARSKISGFEWTYVSLPVRADEPITFYGRVTNQHAFRGEYGSTATFNSKTGALEGSVDIRTSGFWNQVTDAFMPLHYGTFGALPVKLLWCLGGLAPGILATTGYVLWWKRRRALRTRRRAVPRAIEDILR